MSKRSGEPDELRLLRDEVKRRIDYRAFFLRYLSADARASGARLHALCPVPAHKHSGKGSPSFSADVRRGLFHCFSRGEGGDVFTFYELMHGATFPQAVRALARELGIDANNTRQPSLALDAAPDAEAPGFETLEPIDPDCMSALCEAFLATCRDEEQLDGLSYLA